MEGLTDEGLEAEISINLNNIQITNDAKCLNVWWMFDANVYFHIMLI